MPQGTPTGRILHDAERATRKPDASGHDKADAKLIEQQVAGEKLRARHAASRADDRKAENDVDAKLDKVLGDTFPGSDPVSFVQAAPVKKHDRKLSTVPDEKARDKD